MFVLQVATRLLSTGECHDDPLVLRIQVTIVWDQSGSWNIKFVRAFNDWELEGL